MEENKNSATNRVTMMIVPTHLTLTKSSSSVWKTLVMKANKQFKELEESGFHVIFNKTISGDSVIVFLSFWTNLSAAPSGDFFTKELKEQIQKVSGLIRKMDSVDDFYDAPDDDLHFYDVEMDWKKEDF